MTMPDRRWSDADRELMAGALYHACDPDPCPEWGILAERYPAVAGLWRRNAEPVLEAFTAAGWRREADVRAEVSTEIAAAIRQQLTDTEGDDA